MASESANVRQSNHNEDPKPFEKEFRLRQIELIEAFKHFENPFFDPPEELMNIVSKELMSGKVYRSVRIAL